ncbi:GNAT family protein [Streptomyces ficellus]|uniref:GNAT family protein n=2 Tax=Streptomyces ficellus TaxID=1977088 RepID=A0ABT7Z3L3_9ACTN|nr:GNAT family protein [Streptomyces ficellus]MDN3294080.1 GNAT family protein [Streptomyces ficellus]
MASPEEIRAAHHSGSVTFRMIDDTSGEPLGFVNWRQRGSHQSYEIAIIVGDADRWKSAYGGEAIVRLIDLLFMTYDARRVQLTTGAFNVHTIPPLIRGNFVLEGILRNFYYLDGRYHDATVWSMLRSEYEAELKKTEHLAGMKYLPTVPETDKARAHHMLWDYIAQGGRTSMDVDDLLTDVAPAPLETVKSVTTAEGGDDA